MCANYLKTRQIPQYKKKKKNCTEAAHATAAPVAPSVHNMGDLIGPRSRVRPLLEVHFLFTDLSSKERGFPLRYPRPTPKEKTMGTRLATLPPHRHMAETPNVGANTSFIQTKNHRPNHFNHLKCAKGNSLVLRGFAGMPVVWIASVRLSSGALTGLFLFFFFFFALFHLAATR